MMKLNLPNFSKIRVNQIEKGLDTIIGLNRKELDRLLEQKNHTWQNFVLPYEEIQDSLNSFWSPISHLYSVKNSAALRKVYPECIAKISDYYTDLIQNKKLYSVFFKLNKKKHNKAKTHFLKDTLKDFRLSGINLKKDDQTKYKKIVNNLVSLQNTFSNNVLDATENHMLKISDIKKLNGIPKENISQAKTLATQKKIKGALLDLHFPTYLAVMRYADDRKVRQKMYHAYVTRASELGSDRGKFDNGKVIKKILLQRHKLANLLKFNNYAQLSLQRKMAKNAKEVQGFLYSLQDRSKTKAKKEIDELVKYGKDQGIKQIKPWDVEYLREKYKNKYFAISQEELKEYFPEDAVLKGLFSFIKKLFGLRVERIYPNVWHKDVKVFKIKDQSNQLRGIIYFDLYARKNKRAGAWMDICNTRRKLKDNTIQIPSAYLICNFQPPAKGKQALLAPDDILTLFHECGHNLHHILSTIDVMGVSGVNGVLWDVVEMPSQLLERWCWVKEVLQGCSKHYKTNKKMPDSLFNKFLKIKNYHSASHMLRQLELGIFDFNLHLNYKQGKANYVQKTLNDARKSTSFIPTPEYNRFQNSFSHIFGGGYAAGYYSYKWAEVLSCDVFSKFEQEGYVSQKLGKELLHHILEKGGSEPFLDLFKSFMGRKPKVDALLRQSGIIS